MLDVLAMTSSREKKQPDWGNIFTEHFQFSGTFYLDRCMNVITTYNNNNKANRIKWRVYSSCACLYLCLMCLHRCQIQWKWFVCVYVSLSMQSAALCTLLLTAFSSYVWAFPVEYLEYTHGHPNVHMFKRHHSNHHQSTRTISKWCFVDVFFSSFFYAALHAQRLIFEIMSLQTYSLRIERQKK